MSAGRSSVAATDLTRRTIRAQLREPPRNTLAMFIAQELRMKSRGILTWGALLGLYGAAMVATFPSLEGQLDLDMYPRAFREAFGISDMGSIGGFLSAQMFNWVPIILALFPILVLSGAIAGSEERGSIDVLLSNPLPRWQLVIGSFVTAAVSLLCILAVLGLFLWVPALVLGVNLSFGEAFAAALNLWPICLFFGGLALLCSAIFRRRVLAIAVPGVVLFGMYLIDVLGGLVEELESLASVSAFNYYGSALGGSIDWASFLGLVVSAVALGALAVLAFRRRDIYT